MIAVVLARGAGRRMRQADPAAAGLNAAQRSAADAGAKVMMPVGDGASRPFLDYVLSALADAGCDEVCLVVAPDHEALQARYGHGRTTRLRVHFTVQPEPNGTAQAVLATAPVVGSRPFLVANGDNLYPAGALRALVALPGPGVAAFTRASLVEESGFDLERVARFATLTADADGWLTGVREKPPVDDVAALPPDSLISMNLWRFDAAIFAACRDVPASARGEYELPEAVRLAVSRGSRVRIVPARGAVLDLTSRGDIAGVSARLAHLEPRL